MRFIPYTFTKSDIIGDFDNDKQYENWLASQVKAKRIAKVRNGLYVHIDVAGYPLTTKFEIASKIKKDSFVAYHSALEYYGVANQVFNAVTVCSENKFNTFTFDDIEYVLKQVKNKTQVIYIQKAAVRVTTLERTIVDCIDDINLGGGIEEILNALEHIRVLDESRLLEVLKSYSKVLLYQKIGYILEQYQEKFSFSDGFFEKCKSQLTNQIKYFLEDEYKDIEYNSTWKLMAPKNLKARINGGY